MKMPKKPKLNGHLLNNHRSVKKYGYFLPLVLNFSITVSSSVLMFAI
jgi:hypothetical protein